MTSRDFCYWLQGFFEITETGPKPPEWALSLHGSQVEMIRKHLELVFKHEISPPEKTPVDLAKIHQAVTGRYDYAVC